jgi:hypothetical protein
MRRIRKSRDYMWACIAGTAGARVLTSEKFSNKLLRVTRRAAKSFSCPHHDRIEGINLRINYGVSISSPTNHAYKETLLSLDGQHRMLYRAKVLSRRIGSFKTVELGEVQGRYRSMDEAIPALSRLAYEQWPSKHTAIAIYARTSKLRAAELTGKIFPKSS